MALKSLFSLELLAIVLASISLLVLCRGQLPDEVVMLTSQCVSEDGLNLTCTVRNVAHLFWFFNGSNTRHYEYVRRSPDEQCSCDPTFDSMLPGVQVTVQEATGADWFDAVSILSANLPSLLALNIHSVECGSANTHNQSVVINSDIECAALLSLTSQPETTGRFCPGPVTFTCVGTEVNSSVSWLVNGSSVVTYEYQSNDTYPLIPSVDPSLDGVIATVSSASTNPSVTNRFNVISTLSVSDVSILDKTALHCQDASGDTSETLDIQIGLLDSPPSINFTSCSLLPSSGGANIFLQWSPSFTSQFAVEKYHVSVNPDPSSCSSDQVSPSENYSCSGLVLGTRYTFTVSAINCGDQEGEGNRFNTFIEGPSQPADFVFSSQHHNNSIQWTESSYVFEGCLPVGDIEYIVEIVGNTGEVVEQRVVITDSCSNGTCSILIPPSGTCLVRVQATSPFGNSTAELNSAGVRLTITNQALLVAGVIVLLVAIVIAIIMVIMTRIKKGSKLSFLHFLVGCVLISLSTVLWVAVAFQVGLQENTCDPSWQSTRDGLIITVHVISDLAFLVEVVAAGLACVAIYCGTKSTSNNKCLLKWFGPHRAKTEPITNVEEEEKNLDVKLEEINPSELKRGPGGRVQELERLPDCTFKQPGETAVKATRRTQEELYKQYDSKLKEQQAALKVKEEQEAAQYDTTTHVKSSEGATPTQPSSTQPAKYSVLNRLKKKEKGDGDYRKLDHGKGKQDDSVNEHRDPYPATEEYETLEMPPPAPKKPARSPQPNTSNTVPGRSMSAPNSVDGASDDEARSKQIKEDLIYNTLANKFPRRKIKLVLDEEHEGEDRHLVRIAETFDEDWDKTVAPALGLTPEEIKSIKKKFKPKPEMQKREALKVWKNRERENATYGNLLRLLVTCENKQYASTLPDLWSSRV